MGVSDISNNQSWLLVMDKFNNIYNESYGYAYH